MKKKYLVILIILILIAGISFKIIKQRRDNDPKIQIAKILDYYYIGALAKDDRKDDSKFDSTTNKTLELLNPYIKEDFTGISDKEKEELISFYNNIYKLVDAHSEYIEKMYDRDHYSELIEYENGLLEVYKNLSNLYSLGFEYNKKLKENADINIKELSPSEIKPNKVHDCRIMKVKVKVLGLRELSDSEIEKIADSFEYGVGSFFGERVYTLKVEVDNYGKNNFNAFSDSDTLEYVIDASDNAKDFSGVMHAGNIKIMADPKNDKETEPGKKSIYNFLIVEKDEYKNASDMTIVLFGIQNPLTCTFSLNNNK